MSVDRTFEPDAATVSLVRHFVRDAVEPYAIESQTVDACVLLSSELAANVVEHARTPYEVGVEIVGDVARVEIRDGSAVGPAVRDLVDVEDDRGRGLRIVSELADRWGTETRPDGKSVWFEVDIRAKRRP
jgi:anti-sigma regulatory factor (Ser/Thr protein kinase)